MADLSKISINGVEYNVKDSVARNIYAAYYMDAEATYPVEGFASYNVSRNSLSNGGSGIKAGDLLISSNGVLCKVRSVSSNTVGYDPIAKIGGSGNDSGGNVDLGVTGATVGQTVKISSVDENGVPTAWLPTDFPSGGGVKWVQIADVITEEAVSKIKVDEGIPDGIIALLFRIETNYEESVGYDYFTPQINDSSFWPSNIGLRNATNYYIFDCEIHDDGTMHILQGGANVQSFAMYGATGTITLPITSVGMSHSASNGLLAAGTVFKAWAKIGG